jgi:hypothetical protein
MKSLPTLTWTLGSFLVTQAQRALSSPSRDDCWQACEILHSHIVLRGCCMRRCRAAYFRQVEYGMFTRMALLGSVLGKL